MAEIESKLLTYLLDPKWIERAYKAEKKRRGISQDRLAFLSVSDIAQQLYCPMKAVLSCRRDESEYFTAYITDSLICADKMGRLVKWPRTLSAILQIAAEITHEDLALLYSLESKREKLPAAASKGSVNILTATTEKFERGRLAQSQYAEKHGAFRSHWDWDGYVITGIPDGLTDDFVYEFKYTANPRYRQYAVASANLQADLYGLLFDRKRKRTQVLAGESNAVETMESDVDRQRASKVIADFIAIERGALPWSEHEGKCKVCNVAMVCPVRGKYYPLPTIALRDL